MGRATTREPCGHARARAERPSWRHSTVTGPVGGSRGRALAGAAPAPLRVATLPFAWSPSLDPTLRAFVQSALVPAVNARLAAMLSVVPVDGPLFAHRTCDWYDESATPARCVQYAAATGCANDPTTDDVPITFTPSQLGADVEWHYSAASRRYDVPVTLPAGAGTPGADFGIFITLQATALCTSGHGVIAYATSCQRDGATDRPTWGRVNLCPNVLSAYYSDVGTASNVLTHEILHALGFTSDSWPLFRYGDAARTPRTPRNPRYPFVPDDAHTAYYACGGRTSAAYFSEANTVGYFAERGMGACAPPVGVYPPGNCVARFVTPAAAAAAQAFFNCSALPGPEIENQPTTPCELEGSHWEFRVGVAEAMNSFATGNRQAFSAMTVAVFEDAGWGFRGNYGGADVFRHDADFGFGQGCAFAAGACLAPTTPGSLTLVGTGTPPHYYGRTISDESVCTMDRSGYGGVRIAQAQAPIPVQYRWFPGQPTLGSAQYFSVPAVRRWLLAPSVACRVVSRA